MRILLLVLLLFVIFPTRSPAPVGPEPHPWGDVTSVDPATRTFVCHWKTKDWTYSFTDATKFFVGKKPGSLTDLKTGETIRVTYHLQDKTRVADTVTIKKP